MNYPLKFDTCPSCGSQARIAETETNEEIEKGNLPEKARTAVMVAQVRIFDPSDKTILLVRREIPIIFAFIDICVDCGTLYAVEVQKGTGIVEPQITKGPQSPDQGFPFSFGKS